MKFLSQIVQLNQTDFTKLLSNIGSQVTINGHNIQYDQNTLYLFENNIVEWARGADRAVRSDKSYLSKLSKKSKLIFSQPIDVDINGTNGYSLAFIENIQLPGPPNKPHGINTEYDNYYLVKYTNNFYYDQDNSILYGNKFIGTFEGHYKGNLWINNDTTSNASRPLLWSDSTSSGYANIKQSYSKLYYNPSTSVLTNAGTVLSSGTPGFANDVAASKWAYSRFKSGTYEWHIGTNSGTTGILAQAGSFEIRSAGSSYTGIAVRYNTSSFGKLVVTATAGSTGEVSIGLRRGTSGNPQWVFGIISTNDRFGFYNTAQGKWKANFSPNGNLYLGDGDTAASYKLHVMGDALLKEGKIYIFDTGNFVASDGNNQSIYLSTNNKIVSLNSNDNAFRRGTASTSANLTLGTASYRWANIYSVLGNFSGQITSSVATGTSPFAITSTTLNTNLNADLLDGVHLSMIYKSGLADSYGKSDLPWHLVAERTFSKSTQTNTGITLFVKRFLSGTGSGILIIRSRWEANATEPSSTTHHAYWLVNNGLDINNFVLTYKLDTTTNIVSLKLYCKHTGWGTYTFQKIHEGGWSVDEDAWNLYIANRNASNYASYCFATIPADETQSISQLLDISNNAASATILKTARTLTIGATGRSFDGSANISWTLANIFGTTTIGSTTQPIYWNGSNFATTYKLSAEVESGVTNKMARYSSNTKISPASRIWATNNSLFINMDGVITDTTYKFAVAGGSSVIETTVPKMHNTYFLGSTDRRWKESYNVEEYVGTASGSQCHLNFDDTNKCLRFTFD